MTPREKGLLAKVQGLNPECFKEATLNHFMSYPRSTWQRWKCVYVGLCVWVCVWVRARACVHVLVYTLSAPSHPYKHTHARTYARTHARTHHSVTHKCAYDQHAGAADRTAHN